MPSAAAARKAKEKQLDSIYDSLKNSLATAGFADVYKLSKELLDKAVDIDGRKRLERGMDTVTRALRELQAVHEKYPNANELAQNYKGRNESIRRWLNGETVLRLPEVDCDVIDADRSKWATVIAECIEATYDPGKTLVVLLAPCADCDLNAQLHHLAVKLQDMSGRSEHRIDVASYDDLVRSEKGGSDYAMDKYLSISETNHRRRVTGEEAFRILVLYSKDSIAQVEQLATRHLSKHKGPLPSNTASIRKSAIRFLAVGVPGSNSLLHAWGCEQPDTFKLLLMRDDPQLEQIPGAIGGMVGNLREEDVEACVVNVAENEA